MPKKKKQTASADNGKDLCLLRTPPIRPDGAVKIPAIRLVYLPFGILIDKFAPFAMAALIYALLISLLSFVFGYPYVCTTGIPAASFCSQTDGFYALYMLAKYFLLFLFSANWYRLAFEDKPFTIKNLFFINRSTLTAMGILALFLVLNFTPMLSFYLLWIREPNPDVVVEVTYFAVVSIGFLVPFAVMRFYSLFGFALDDCRLPGLREVWTRSRGNTLRILVALFLIFFLALFVFFNMFVSIQGYAGSNTLWGGISSEYLYEFLLLLLTTLFINHCYLQKLFLFGESVDEGNN